MSRYHLVIALLLGSIGVKAQHSVIDSLRHNAKQSINDTVKLIGYRNLSRLYAELDPDSANYYGEESLVLAKKLKLKLDEAGALREIGYSYLNQGNYPRSLQTLLSALEILEDSNSERNVLVGNYPGDDELMHHSASPRAQRLSEQGFTHEIMGILYANSNNLEKSLYHHQIAGKLAKESGNVPLQCIVYLTASRVYMGLNKVDSALYSIHQSYERAMKSGFKNYLGSILLNTGRTHAAMGNAGLANEYYRKSFQESTEHGYLRGVVAASLLLANEKLTTHETDSAFYFISTAYKAALGMDAPDLLVRTYSEWVKFYTVTGKADSIVKYQAMIISINDSRINSKQVQDFQNIDFNEQQRQYELEAARKEFQGRIRLNIFLGSTFTLVLIAFLLYRSSRIKQKAKQNIEKAFEQLKATQSQLIQSEKMASLGVLTAGIAHEIQNPLNFVNNFSEVNKELIAEMLEEIKNGNYKEAETIAKDINDNQEKINHHGKRADDIVKGMLQHSRSSSGVKEPTDLNALADEYLRLAYHGLRAKDKSFNATLNTEFDEAIGKINVVSQDIGRVILNLITNAFYAVSEKKKTQPEGYEPIVKVITRKEGDKILISVKDNGNGIPDHIKEKIFQPFFTTKPTGQGTGLGLSLAYDIVKAHGGELKVETEENEGSEFAIKLPV